MDGSELQTKPAVAVQKPLPDLEGSDNTDVVADGRALVVPDRAKPVDATQLELSEASPTLYIPSDKIVLGEELDEQGRKTGKAITLGGVELFAGTHELGLPRYGKSALLINLFLQLAQKGYGAAYFDPHGDAITDIRARLPLHRENDVIILDPTHETHTFGLNLLTCDNLSSDTALTYAYDQLWSVFTKLWADKETGEMGIWMQKFVSNAILTFLEHPGYTVADIPLLLTSKAHRKYFAKTLKNSVVARFWTAEFDSLPKNYQWVEIESTLTRLNRFLQNPIIRSIVGQSRSTLNFREIMDTKKLLLVHFPVRLPEDFRTLLGAMLITQLQDAMFSRRDTPKPDRVPFFLIVDEVQEVSTKQFTKFFEEGGKYHVATIAAHQHLSQEGLSLAVRNGLLTAGNKVYLRVNDTDADVVAPGFAKAPEKAVIKTAIPAEVLSYLKYHSLPAVRQFYALFLSPLDEALELHERYEHDSYMTLSGGRVNVTEEIKPVWNFGSGDMEYKTVEIRKLRKLWNTLLRETMEQKMSQQKMGELRQAVIDSMAVYLDYEDYGRFLYNKASHIFTPSADRQDICEYEGLKDLLASFKGSDLDIFRFFCASYTKEPWNGTAHPYVRVYPEYKKVFDGYVVCPTIASARRMEQDRNKLPKWLRQNKERPGEECRQYFLEKVAQYHTQASRYQSARTYVQFVIDNSGKPSLEYWKGVRSDSIAGTVKYERWKWWWLGDFGQRLLLGSIESEIARRLPYKDCAVKGQSDLFWFEIGNTTIAEASIILASPEALIKQLSKPNSGSKLYFSNHGYFHDTTDATWEEIKRQCREKYAYFEPRSTTEKLLTTIRAELEAEVAEIEIKLKPLQEEYDRKLEYRRQLLEARKAGEKKRHDSFTGCLDALLEILMEPEYKIKVVASDNDHQKREPTERDMIDEAARLLRNLPKYTAWCKIAEGEQTVIHQIALPPLPPAHANDVVEAMTQRIWGRMERDYYRPKTIITEEMAKRQELPTPETSAFVKLPGRI